LKKTITAKTITATNDAVVEMATELVNPGTGISLLKQILIPAAAVGAIGLLGLGGFQQTGERACTRAECVAPKR
jgi:hypothetical protein